MGACHNEIGYYYHQDKPFSCISAWQGIKAAYNTIYINALTETSMWSNPWQGEEIEDWESLPGKITENHSRAWSWKRKQVSWTDGSVIGLRDESKGLKSGGTAWIKFSPRVRASFLLIRRSLWLPVLVSASEDCDCFPSRREKSPRNRKQTSVKKGSENVATSSGKVRRVPSL